MFMPGYRLSAAIPAVALLASGALATAQAPPTPAPASVTPAAAIAGLRPVLGQIGAAMEDLRISRWKAPQELRSSSQEDVTSIQRDLSATLPPLLDQAQAANSASAPLAPSFAVFRNIDALYDVLLRVTEMATLAGSAADAAHLEDARAALEQARSQLANSLLASVSSQDAELARLRARSVEVAKPPPPAPPTTVIDDGAAPAKPHKKKPKKTTPPPQQ
jgi:hypothetical protein